MIRGIDNKGALILGITRREIDGLLDGLRCCFPSKLPEAPGPHICLWFAETDADLLAKLDEMYPEGVPAEIKDYRTAAGTEAAWRAGIESPETLRAYERQRAARPIETQVADWRRAADSAEALEAYWRGIADGQRRIDAEQRRIDAERQLQGARWELLVTLRMRQHRLTPKEGR